MLKLFLLFTIVAYSSAHAIKPQSAKGKPPPGHAVDGVGAPKVKRYIFSMGSANVAKREVAMPQQDCVEECKREGKSTTNCETSCTVLNPMERHVTPPLDADCVQKCNGGDVTAANPLKAECEQQCLFKEPSPVVAKREADSEEAGCKTECHPTEDGKGKECKTTCKGKLPGTGRVTGQLDKACVEECNGGMFPTKLEELKPECEQKCAFKGPVQVVAQKKTEFDSKEACLQYCQEKSLGQSEQECNEKCHHTFSGMAQG